MKLTSLFVGPGSRRRSTDSVIVLERENRSLRGEVSRLDPCECRRPQQHVAFLVRRPEGLPAPAVPPRCPACELDRLQAQHRAQMAVLTAPVAPPSPVLVRAAADVPGSVFAEPEPPVVADPRLRIVADTPTAPAESEAADVNADTQAVAVSALWEAIGEGETAQLPAILDPQPAAPVVTEPSSAEHLERARVPVPPKPKMPPVHLVEQQLVTWKPTFAKADPLAAEDLKATVSAAAVLVSPGWQSARVSLSKTG